MPLLVPLYANVSPMPSENTFNFTYLFCRHPVYGGLYDVMLCACRASNNSELIVYDIYVVTSYVERRFKSNKTGVWGLDLWIFKYTFVAGLLPLHHQHSSPAL